MAGIPKIAQKAITTTNDATDWVELSPGERCSISIPTGITGVVRLQRSFDGGTTNHNITDDSGLSDFSGGAQLDYIASSSHQIRIIATSVTSGSATVLIKRG